MRGNILKKEIIFGIIILMISTSPMPVFAGNDTRSSNEQKITSTPIPTPEETTTMTFYIFEKTKLEKYTTTISTQDATTINTQFQELKKDLRAHPYNELIQQHVQQFIDLLEAKHALPTGMSAQELNTLLEPPKTPAHPLRKGILPLQEQSSEWFCNFATTGTGAAFPIIILPRIIPFILMPIPRIFVKWSTPDGITSVGGLRSQTGFIATGQQKGLALGFWGIGFSIFLPPVDQYGIIGYALFARVTADYMEFWPLNNPPEITQTDPADGQTMVKLTTKELRFSISDADKKDLMSYNVTTNPDIGSGSGGLKSSGVYSIPISGLESLTQYTWHITVTDGKDTTEKTSTFTTEPAAPILSNPSPADGERHAPTDLQQLQFTIKDFQGDLMDYTVQTSPNIGSGSGTDVHNGTYSVAVSGLQNYTSYRWYVNVTDGTHWTRKTFSFETGYLTYYDPFERGWHYRKQITIDHSNIPEDLTNFPVLISIVDNDLRQKAQPTGDDILFMDNTGLATLLNYEIEKYDGAQGALTAWVNISQLSSSEDTVFYMYYGNPATLSQQIPEKTWDSHFQGVWHMNDATSSTIADSTMNRYVGTKEEPGEPFEVNGRVGESQHFDGTYAYIQLGSTIIPTGTKTVSAWVKKEKNGWQQVLANSQGDGSPNAGTAWCFDDTSGGIIEFDLGNAGEYDHYIKVRVPVPDFEWHYYTMVFDSSSPCLYGYRDGTLVVTSTTVSGSEAPPNYNLRMGRSNDGYTPYLLTGGLDEVRVSTNMESPQWIAVDYANQNNPSGFFTVGPEVPGP